MTTKYPSTFKVIQAYAGVKEALFTVENVTAGDIIDFTQSAIVTSPVKGIQAKSVDTAAGAPQACQICGSDRNQLIVGSGPSAEYLSGTIKFRDY